MEYTVPVMPAMPSAPGSTRRKLPLSERETDTVAIRGLTGGGQREYLSLADLNEHLDSRARRLEARLARTHKVPEILTFSLQIETISALREKVSNLKPPKGESDDALFDFDSQYQLVYDQLVANLRGLFGAESEAQAMGTRAAQEAARGLIREAAAARSVDSESEEEGE